ncbi:MAG TPA: hypothetical protein VHO29_18325 [Marmoricola sp.]|jgi:hypothetical protein|nr:hypothetical protein [Marmoricola sp.]
MSGVAPSVDAPAPPERRVREAARDGLAVMAFSAVTSVALATLLTLLAGLGK